MVVEVLVEQLWSTWVQIPRSHIKVGEVMSICYPSPPRARGHMEIKDSQTLQGQFHMCSCVQKTLFPPKWKMISTPALWYKVFTITSTKLGTCMHTYIDDIQELQNLFFKLELFKSKQALWTTEEQAECAVKWSIF